MGTLASLLASQGYLSSRQNLPTSDVVLKLEELRKRLGIMEGFKPDNIPLRRASEILCSLVEGINKHTTRDNTQTDEHRHFAQPA